MAQTVPTSRDEGPWSSHAFEGKKGSCKLHCELQGTSSQAPELLLGFDCLITRVEGLSYRTEPVPLKHRFNIPYNNETWCSASLA